MITHRSRYEIKEEGYEINFMNDLTYSLVDRIDDKKNIVKY